MPTQVRMLGGPLNGKSLEIDELRGDTVAIPVNEQLAPVQADYAVAIYHRSGSNNEVTFSFKGFQRQNGHPFDIDFADGPNAGIRPGPQPIQVMPLKAVIPLGENNEVFKDDGNDPVAIAVYTKRQDQQDRFRYFLEGIDSSTDVMQPIKDQVNEARITDAINNFYSKPDYSIYSIQPTGDHKQVLVEREHRRALVDERLGPLISELWRLNLDTLGSCQERPEGTPNAGMAYIAFIRLRDAEKFRNVLDEAQITYHFKEKEFEIARKASLGKASGASEIKRLKWPAGDILFATTDIGRVTEAVRLIAK